MKKIFTILAVIFLPIIGVAESPRGDLIFSISVVETAFYGAQTNKTGFFVYYDQSDSSTLGYRYKHGKVVDVFGGGIRGKQFIKELNAIKISPFDFESEIEAAKKEEKKQTGKQMGIITTDGAKYNIFYSFRDNSFTYTGWNPGAKLFYYSDYNENIHNLNRIVDLFAEYYGRQQFGL